MVKLLSILFTGVVTSMYFFPFVFKAFPVGNTKMMMAAVGLLLFIISRGERKSGDLDKGTFWLSIFAIVTSIFGFVSIVYNNTPDTAYATYIISMWVWIGGAYCVIRTIRWVHVKATVGLIANYLIAVCVFQCLIALWIDGSADVKRFVDGYIYQGQDFLSLHNVDRLYGIGASLDIAGSRFACVLIMIVYLLYNKDITRNSIPLYVLAFVVIAVVGNMIARTTTVGLIIAVGCLLYFAFKKTGNKNKKFIHGWIFGILALTITVVTYYYQVDANFRSDLRFGFEGFFSLVEKGEWQSDSQDRLATMYVFPDNLKTWIIGDGYFDNPVWKDPYFIGKFIAGFYMGTDVGYLRFIFYFGVLGLAAMCAVIYKAAQICYRRCYEYRWMFVLLWAVNMIVWFKVSTDIFLVFALFLMLDPEEMASKDRTLISEPDLNITKEAETQPIM